MNPYDSTARIPDSSTARAASAILKVHIIECSCAGPDHLEAGKPCPQVYIITGQMGFERPDLLRKPVLQDHVVGISPSNVIAAWVWVLTSPGSAIAPSPSMINSASPLTFRPLFFTHPGDGSRIINKNINEFPFQPSRS